MSFTPETSLTIANIVFRNELLVENILSHSPLEIGIRLLGRAFNSVYLRKIRKDHSVLHISQLDPDTEEPAGVSSVVVNDFEIRLSKLPNYLKFLDEVARVKVTNLRISSFYEPEKVMQDRIHQALIQMILRNLDKLESFVGMNFLCPKGCDDCNRIALRCEEYGPVQHSFLKLIAPKHYKMIMVSELLLHEIAIPIVDKAISKQHALELLADYINPNITCDTFMMCLTDQCELPREVLDSFLKKWKAKSMELSFNGGLRIYGSSQWLKYWYFTEFNWAVSYDTLEANDLELESVTVDLRYSDFWKRKVLQNPMNMSSNLISSTRKLLPTNNIHLVMPDFSATQVQVESILDNILTIIWRKEPTDLDVDVSMRFTDVGDNVLEISNISDFYEIEIDVVSDDDEFPVTQVFVRDPVSNCTVVFHICVT